MRIDDVSEMIFHDVIESRVLQGCLDFIAIFLRYLCYCESRFRFSLTQTDHLILRYDSNHEPYQKHDIVWTIWYGQFQIVRSIRNCQFCLDAQEQTLLYLRNQLQLKSPSDLFQRGNSPYKKYFISTDWLPEISITHVLSQYYWPAMTGMVRFESFFAI